MMRQSCITICLNITQTTEDKHTAVTLLGILQLLKHSTIAYYIAVIPRQRFHSDVLYMYSVIYCKYIDLFQGLSIHQKWMGVL